MTLQITFASEPAPGATNEDHVIAVPGLVCVLDGVTAPAELTTGCVHGTPWYVRRLAARLADVHSADPDADAALGDLVASAIDAVRGDHGGMCDLAHPGTPASTLCLLRVGELAADFFVLSDSPLVLDRSGAIEVVTDLRLNRSSTRQRQAVASNTAAVGTREHRSRVVALVEAQRPYRNRPGGFWLAAAMPEAGHNAVTGAVPLTGTDRLTRAALVTDGAARLVDMFSIMDWTGLLDLAQSRGPAAVIDQVRGAEHRDTSGTGRTRTKMHDDATIAFCVF